MDDIDDLFEQIQQLIADEERRLVRAYFALPQCERDAFLRQIEVASLRWRAPAPTRGTT